VIAKRVKRKVSRLNFIEEPKNVAVKDEAGVARYFKNKKRAFSDDFKVERVVPRSTVDCLDYILRVFFFEHYEIVDVHLFTVWEHLSKF